MPSAAMRQGAAQLVLMDRSSGSCGRAKVAAGASGPGGQAQSYTEHGHLPSDPGGHACPLSRRARDGFTGEYLQTPSAVMSACRWLDP